MKPLAKISARPGVDPGAGSLRERDLEAFDGLLEKLEGCTCVLVTGTEERKSAGAIGLAAAAAAAGRRTMLLECELAVPALAGELRLDAKPGLHEYLRQEVGAPDVLQALVLAGPGSARAVGPLVCVVAGRPTEDGRELLESDGFRNAAARLSAGYDLVVLDGPRLGRDIAQLEAAAVPADASIACLGQSDARGRYPRRLRRILQQMPSRFAGIVAFE